MIVKYLAYYFTLCLILTIGSGLRCFLKEKYQRRIKKEKKQIENVKKGNTEYHSYHFIAFIFVSHKV